MWYVARLGASSSSALWGTGTSSASLCGCAETQAKGPRKGGYAHSQHIVSKVTCNCMQCQHCLCVAQRRKSSLHLHTHSDCSNTHAHSTPQRSPPVQLYCCAPVSCPEGVIASRLEPLSLTAWPAVYLLLLQCAGRRIECTHSMWGEICSTASAHVAA